MSTTVIPHGGREIIERMTRKFPELFVNVDEEQRKLTTKIAQQFVFVYGLQWGNKKRAGLSDDFKSKDSLACLESDATISIWDMFSSGLDILVQDGQAPAFPNDSPGNTTFMPVEPFNWLGDAGPEPPDPPPDNGKLEARVKALEDAQAAQLDINDDLAQALGDVTGRVHVLEERLGHVEAELAKPKKVVGRTTATWGHQHTVNLDVTTAD